MRLRVLVASMAAVAALAVAAILLAPLARSAMLVDLVTGLAWPLVLLVVVAVFWPQLGELAAVASTRVRQGAAFQVGMISVSSLSEQAARIPSPATTEPVTPANIALLHTSFVRADETAKRGDGRTYYQFEVVVIAPDDVLRRIESVTYELDQAWPQHLRVRTITDRSLRFKLKELANGTSIVQARITLQDQEQPVLLNRFIDLRPDGPRL